MNTNTFPTIKWLGFAMFFLIGFNSNIKANGVNSCNVTKQLNPTILCPSDKTIECSQYLYNFEILGQPTSSSNFTPIKLKRVDDNKLNECGLGTVIRKWVSIDKHGYQSICIQTITVINSYPFDVNDIVYPRNLTTSECGTSALTPEHLPHPYSKPILNKDDCDQVTMTYKDTYHSVSGPACFKILREWTVIDKCQLNSNAVPDVNGNIPGQWKYTQTIKVLDFTPPTFVTCPKDITIETLEANCEKTYVELTSKAMDCSPDLSYHYEIDLFNDGDIDKTGLTNNASDQFPMGYHKILFTVTDGCGNLASHSYFFLIKDGTQPMLTKINEYGLLTFFKTKNGG